jgi:hypothetical protein
MGVLQFAASAALEAAAVRERNKLEIREGLESETPIVACG